MLRFRKKKAKKDKDKEDSGTPDSSPRESEERTILDPAVLRRTSKDANGTSSFFVDTPLQATQEARRRSESYQTLTWKPPVINKYYPRTTRLLHLKRLPTGDFGFTLRKGYILDRIIGCGKVSHVIFAEPGVGNRQFLTSLLPGDRLMEINGQSVESCVREEVIEVIRGTGNELSLGVQAIPELCEVNAASGSSENVMMRYNSTEPGEATTEVEIMWMKTDDGYTQAKVVGPLQNYEGIYEILAENGQKIQVKEKHLERANPEGLNFSQNLGLLRFVNESSFLHTLRCRYANNLIHTYAGPTLLIVNPIYPLAIYSEKVSNAIKNTKVDLLPPHIYSLARKVYDDMILWKRNQSVVFLGHSGSGKTTNVRHLLNYMVSNSHGKFICPEKLHTVFTILDYMIYSRSNQSCQSNRSTQVYCLDFDQSGRMCSMSLQLTILGRQCSFRRSPDEQPVDLVSQMVTGLDANQKSDLFLTGTTSIQKIIEHNKAAQSWPKFASSLKTVGFTDSDIKAMCYLTAALIHLSNIRLHEGQGKDKFLTMDPARRAATLLGLDLEDLARYIFDRDESQNDVQNGEVGSVLSPSQLLEHFINCVYSDVVNVVVSGINRYLSSDDRIANSVLVFDSPGFKANSGQATSTLNDLCDNYVQERLQDHYAQTTLDSIVQKYDEDALAYDYDLEERASVSELLHACPQVSLTPKSALKKRNELNRKGLFWLMEEESMLDQGSDSSFVQKIDLVGTGLIRSAHDGRFTVNHFSGNCKVLYDSRGWLSDCKINRGTRNIVGLLQSSNQDFILKFLRGVHRGARFSGLNIGGSSSLRRTVSMKFGTAGNQISQKALMFQLRAQTDKIVESLGKTHQHFVHCVAPTLNAGVIDGDAELKYSLMTEDKALVKEVMPDIGLLKSQIRSFRLLDIVGFWKRFHPESIRLGDFNRRYGLLAPTDKTFSSEIDRVRNILQFLAIDGSSYNMGKSYVFLRKDIVDKLESCRRNKVGSNIVTFQAYCRGFVVRKMLQKYRSQNLAMGIIQKNVRKHMVLKQWPWWRLFMKVRPLVAVNRMELELQGKDVSLSEVMERVRKIEDERNELKHQVRDSDQRLNVILRELTEEQACSAEISAELELERNKRLQYEKDLESLTQKVSGLSSKNEQLRMDLMQSKVWRSEIEQTIQENEGDANLQEKYEAAIQELQFVKKQFKTDLAEEMEKERKKRKHVESKLTSANADLQKEKEKATGLRDKNARISAELQDIKIYAEEQKSRLQDLARKQDGLGPGGIQEMNEKVSKLKIERQTLVNEQQNLVSENFTMKQELQDLQYENERLQSENRRLQDEVQELADSKGESGDDKIRREYHTLKIKSADQEDELNELSDQVKLLESSKNRLEMQIEAMRRDHAKEIEEKEEEMGDMKSNLQRRLREAEQQLEDEYETKRSLHREKTDLETQLRSALDDRQVVVSDGRVKRLQRDLKRTKALLQDAQAVLDRQRDENASKSQLRQLKNALDDAEFQSSSSSKALKSALAELEECREDLARVTKTKSEYEDKSLRLTRQNGDLQTKVEDLEDEMADIMKKYRSSVDQQSSKSLASDELYDQIQALQNENQTLKEDIATLTSKLEFMDTSTVASEEHHRITAKLKDMESNLDLEKTMRTRFENNVLRLKENIQQLQEDNDDLLGKERRLNDELKRAQRRVSELQDELNDALRREEDSSTKCRALENKVSMLEDDVSRANSELKIANRRLNDLRGQLEDIQSDSYDYLDDSDDAYSEAGSYASSEFGL